MAAVRRVCRVTMDIDVEPCMNVHKKDGGIMKFVEYHSGLYYYDVPLKSNDNTKQQVDPYSYCFVETVAENKNYLLARRLKELKKQSCSMPALDDQVRLFLNQFCPMV